MIALPRGLTAGEAAARVLVDGRNELPASPEPSLARRVATHAVEPLSLVLLAAASISAVVLQHIVEAGAIVAIVVLNVAIAAIEEQRSDRAIAALRHLTAPTARARRDGATVLVDARELVLEDVVDLAAGDRVPADLSVAWSASLAADESMLTGESMPVERAIGDALYAGTMIVRGRATGVVTATGSNTALGKIATALTAPVVPPLVRELRAVALTMSWIALVLGAVLVPVALLRSDESVAEAVLAGVALAVAAIPEGLAAIVTLSLALGARSMAGRGAIIRTLPALETLGATTVICADKTGTLTTGRIELASVHPAHGGDDALWAAALRCIDVNDGTGDPIDEAIAVAAARSGVVMPQATRTGSRPFDAATRSMATVTLEEGRPVLTVKGAPEVVLSRCRTGAEVDRLRELGDDLGARGLRVLAVAQGRTSELDATDLDAVGLLAFADPLRSSAADAVAACRRAGIRVVMVTGDHVATATSIGRALGLDEGPPVTGPDLDGVPRDAAADLLRRAPIVARVLPETKVALVDAHRAVGEVVAMTGDGVNDSPALRAADIGVAVAGGSGTDVAREAADLVVTGGDLGVIVDAIREGRRIYRNITNVVGYLLTGNLSEVLVVGGCLLLIPELAVPLLPVQLLWLNLISDGLPALALGVDRHATDPLDGPPRDATRRLLSADRLTVLALRAAVIAVAVIGTGVFARSQGWDEDAIRGEVLLTLLIAHLLVAYVTRASRRTFEGAWWHNGTLLLAVGGSLALQLPVYLTSWGRRILRLAPLPGKGWVMAAGAAIAAIVVIDVGRALGRRRS